MGPDSFILRWMSALSDGQIANMLPSAASASQENDYLLLFLREAAKRILANVQADHPPLDMEHVDFQDQINSLRLEIRSLQYQVGIIADHLELEI